MIVVTLCPRFVPLSHSPAAISYTRSMSSGTLLSRLTKALLKLVIGLRTRVGISIRGGGGSVCGAVLVLVCIEAESDGEEEAACGEPDYPALIMGRCQGWQRTRELSCPFAYSL